MAEYIILDNDKKPLHKFKNGGKSWDEVKDFDNIAMIVPNPFVVLDFDTEDDAQIMLRIIEELDLHCKVMKTDRGIHCWFKSTKQLKNYVKNRLAIGIYCDRKVCNRNAYVKIRGNGKDREWLRTYDDTEVDLLPKWLVPIQATANHFNFIGMGKGDGRNQELFNYILYLKDKGFNPFEIRETITIINRFVFAEPLPVRELNTIMRDEAFEKTEVKQELAEETGAEAAETSAEEKFKFQHHVFARTIMEDMNIICVNDNFYIYKDGYYQEDQKEIEAKMITMYPAIKVSQRREVTEYLKIIADVTNEIRRRKKNAYEVNLLNGKLNLLTKEFREHSPMDYDFAQIPVEYDASATSEILENTLNDIFCNDESVKNLFYEIVSDCILPSTRSKAFIFYGGGSNGKSTLFYLLEHFLGLNNVAHIELDKLGKSFQAANLENRFANIGDDLNFKAISDNGTIKKLISGEPVQIERKYRDPYSMKSYATQIFATNDLPYSFDKSYGMMRRLCFIPCLAKFGKDGIKRDPRIKAKLTEPSVLSALLNKAIEAFDRLEENGEFTEPKVVIKAKEQYREESSTVLSWVEEAGVDINKIISIPAANLYSEYCLWAKAYSDKPTGKKGFNSEVKWKFNLCDELQARKFNGKTHRFFVAKIEE